MYGDSVSSRRSTLTGRTGRSCHGSEYGGGAALAAFVAAGGSAWPPAWGRGGAPAEEPLARLPTPRARRQRSTPPGREAPDATTGQPGYCARMDVVHRCDAAKPRLFAGGFRGTSALVDL